KWAPKWRLFLRHYGVYFMLGIEAVTMEFDFKLMRFSMAIRQVEQRLRPEVEAGLNLTRYNKDDIDLLVNRAEELVRDICICDQIPLPKDYLHCCAFHIVFDILHPDLRRPDETA